MDKTAIACPYCYTAIGPLSGEDGTVVTIVCSDCGGHYSVDLKSQKVSKKRSGRRARKNDEDEIPEIKLRCPCGCGSYICNLQPVDTIITARCNKSNQFFGANLLTGRTWLLKKNKPRN
ncbi:MAG: hypothetical protein FWC27_15475 [Firmicutes bacterium]|nr:hypothetical protein [Bacillota bacterium]